MTCPNCQAIIQSPRWSIALSRGQCHVCLARLGPSRGATTLVYFGLFVPYVVAQSLFGRAIVSSLPPYLQEAKWLVFTIPLALVLGLYFAVLYLAVGRGYIAKLPPKLPASDTVYLVVFLLVTVFGMLLLVSALGGVA